MPSGEISLQEPPTLSEQAGGGIGGLLMYLPMAIGSGAMMLMFMGNRGGGMALVAVALMSVGMLAMGFGQMGRSAGERKRRMHGERRDYLRYLGQVRKEVRDAASEQRTAQVWRHPDPAGLWSVAMSGRLWERRVSHADFAEIRVGLIPQKLAMTITPPQSKPVEDLEPLSARALRRFIRAYGTVDDLPTAVFLRGFAQVQLRGDAEAARQLVRAMLAQLVTFHSPDDLKVAVCASPDKAAIWDWVKWLPHSQHGSEQDGAGNVRLMTDSADGLEALLASELGERGRFEAGAAPNRDEPYVVVVVDDVALPTESRMMGTGFRNALVVNLVERWPTPANRTTLRLDVAPDKLDMVRNDRSGAEVSTKLAKPDGLSVRKAEALARNISAFRLGATTDVVEPMVTDFDLGTLLGVGEMDQLDPAKVWPRTNGPDRLRVPIGIAENGTKIELDIKESAQGGMGPHGLLIGATGSGKSELLRTLVVALATTHSSEILNFVLVDFKGGATFLGLDELPHTSAVITNLADEAPLVTRMQDALQGEMVRRQELLRSAGNYSSLLEYEKARASGVPLDPMPSLFLVVDEFSELLASHPDFSELFVMIGRLGRSLGVHLLLASQRIDDSRMHKLESHLSYRIGLRTFSAMESRSVIGVPDAYQLPSAPGNGYLRSDVATLVRFKAAYVSAPFKRRTVEQRREEVRRQVVPFGAARLPDRQEQKQPEPVAVAAADTEQPSETLLQVAVSRLRGQGPPAHQVWLPPLDEPPTMDQLLPPLAPDPVLGMTAASWPGRGKLTVPVGVVDKPFEQARDLYMADLSGVGGHVGIAGGTQSGKSTLLRALIAGLALTHTPAEVQIYCLDFGGGTLQTLNELPHVGGVAGRMDGERVSRTVAEVQGVLTTRERLFNKYGVESMSEYRAMRRDGRITEDPFGDVFLVVDGWATVRADFEEHDEPIRQIAARGLTYGIHVVLTTSRWSDIHSALRDQLGTRLELRLGDSIDSVIDMRAAAGVPKQPGRGLTPEKLHFLGAVPRIDGRQRTDDLAQAARALAESVADSWNGPEAPPVRMLPAVLPAAELPAPEGRLRVPLGLGESDLQPVWHDFSRQPHLTVLGDTSSGKTAVLRLIADAVTKNYAPAEAQMILVDSRRMLLEAVPDEYRRGFAFSGSAAGELISPIAAELRERLPGPDISPQQLQRRDWWSGPEIFILVDDYDLLAGAMGGPLDSLLDLLPQAADIGLHVVLARSAAGSSRLSMDSVVRRMQESNTPDLALSCPPTEMPLLNGMRPRTLPPGRAYMVTRRSATLLQTAWLEPAGTAVGSAR
ncbi:S-DNA-T family DNA segregation ATPase FtsK/SpoIIIE [Saccharopolyspora erythraea NRRL 2338]|uniref:ATP/GTP binding protein n=2 Tax=Saccharopolyspora erythraea TaxID=1836 RepID=A4FKY5_SACEN|nr:S-DNA-T family DNA segregation ATPase FtsK/SpoIIIE [Saccharopolyspora erythraea NRRL 2338]QRK93844.1 type VII secretion protein EccCa [Saccharopolyspora erythraea]CAM04710.1 ATP/GTP binding protein [Saccharopolyspora erythraea NRRL 2338]